VRYNLKGLINHELLPRNLRETTVRKEKMPQKVENMVFRLCVFMISVDEDNA
jgi:hypothetical protein